MRNWTKIFRKKRLKEYVLLNLLFLWFKKYSGMHSSTTTIIFLFFVIFTDDSRNISIIYVFHHTFVSKYVLRIK